MDSSPSANSESIVKKVPVGLAVLAMLGPSLVWCAEYIGSGEVILATRTGAILGIGVLWAIILGIFLKFWIGMSGASTPMESSSSGVVSCLQVWTKVRLQRDLENRMLVQIQEELGIKSRKASDGAVE